MRAMDIILATLALITDIATTYPLSAMCVLAFGPIAIVALARNPVGVVIVVGLVIMGLGLALAVTQDGIAVRPLDSAVLRLALALWGALWPIAIAFLIFGRPPVYASVGNGQPQSG
jgi:hypothetical protein